MILLSLLFIKYLHKYGLSIILHFKSRILAIPTLLVRLWKSLKNDLKAFYEVIKPYLTWHFVLCFGIAWMITNGWCYIFIVLGGLLHLPTLSKIGWSYLGFLWLPITPEKVVTIPIACWFTRLIFPKDFKTQELIKSLNKKEKKKFEERNPYAPKPIWEVFGWS